MALFTLNDIEKATGLSMPFIRKCLSRMPDIFVPHQQKGINNSIQLNDSGLIIFQHIMDFKKAGLSVPEIRQKLLDTGILKGSNQEVQATKTESNEPFLKQLYTELENERQRLSREREQHETEIQKRRDVEEALRSIQTEIKLLTGGQTIEDAQRTREIRKLKRVELIAKLEGLRFWHSRKRKKLLAELKALDYENLIPATTKKPAEAQAGNLPQNPISP